MPPRRLRSACSAPAPTAARSASHGEIRRKQKHDIRRVKGSLGSALLREAHVIHGEGGFIGLIEMYIDDATKTFCIYETTKKQYWSVLPLLENIYSGEELLSKASMASIKVTGGTDSYELNTQDNSLAYGKASYTLTDNGAVFTYDIFPDEKTAAKQKYDKTDIGFSLRMTVTLEDGSMIVGCTYKNITATPTPASRAWSC